MNLAPGLRVTGADVGGTGAGTQQNYSNYGTSTGGNKPSLDGVDTREDAGGAGFYYDYGAFQEVQIKAMGNDAEMSVPGTQFLGILKSGGDKFHGSGMYSWESPQPPGQQCHRRPAGPRRQGGQPPDCLPRQQRRPGRAGAEATPVVLRVVSAPAGATGRPWLLHRAGSAGRVQRAHHEHDRETDRPAESQAPLQRLRPVPDEGLSRAQRGRVSLQGSHLAPDLQAAGRQGRVVVDRLRPDLRERLRGPMALRDRRAELHGRPPGLRHGDAPLLGPIQHLALRRRSRPLAVQRQRVALHSERVGRKPRPQGWRGIHRREPHLRRGCAVERTPTTSSGSRTACPTRSSSTTTRTTRSTR